MGVLKVKRPATACLGWGLVCEELVDLQRKKITDAFEVSMY